MIKTSIRLIRQTAAATLFIFATTHAAQAQTPNGFVGVGTTNPKAKLHITNDSSGILIPKYATLTLANSNSLPKLNATDHKGLMIYIDEAANQGFWYYNGTAFVKVAGSGSSFFTVSPANNNNIIYSSAGNYGKNFIVNADSVNKSSGIDYKMMFVGARSAFRVGGISNRNWNLDSIGSYSFASGFNSKATGYTSTAMGMASAATGESSTAIGEMAVASGDKSIAIGSASRALATESIAMGRSSTATGLGSTAIGTFNTASGNYSTVLGFFNTGSGFNATAMGVSSLAAGYASTAIGSNVKAKSYAETAVGLNNTDYTPASVSESNVNDRAFVVGTGSNDASPQDGLIVYKNGTTFIGNNTDNNSTPVTTSTLTVAGAIADNIITTTATSFTFTSETSTVLDNNSTNTATTYTLPNPSTCKGRKIAIKKINAANHAINITCANISAGGTSDGITTPRITVENVTSGNYVASTATTSRKGFILQSDGSNWWVIASF